MNTEQRNLLRSLIEPLIKNTNDNLVINATVGCKANNSFRYQGLSVTALCDIYPGNKVWVFRDTKSGTYYGVREEFNPVLNERNFTRKYIAPPSRRESKPLDFVAALVRTIPSIRIQDIQDISNPDLIQDTEIYLLMDDKYEKATELSLEWRPSGEMNYSFSTTIPNDTVFTHTSETGALSLSSSLVQSGFATRHTLSYYISRTYYSFDSKTYYQEEPVLYTSWIDLFNQTGTCNIVSEEGYWYHDTRFNTFQWTNVDITDTFPYIPARRYAASVTDDYGNDQLFSYFGAVELTGGLVGSTPALSRIGNFLAGPFTCSDEQLSTWSGGSAVQKFTAYGLAARGSFSLSSVNNMDGVNPGNPIISKSTIYSDNYNTVAEQTLVSGAGSQSLSLDKSLQLSNVMGLESYVFRGQGIPTSSLSVSDLEILPNKVPGRSWSHIDKKGWISWVIMYDTVAIQDNEYPSDDMPPSGNLYLEERLYGFSGKDKKISKRKVYARRYYDDGTSQYAEGENIEDLVFSPTTIELVDFWENPKSVNLVWGESVDLDDENKCIDEYIPSPFSFYTQKTGVLAVTKSVLDDVIENGGNIQITQSRVSSTSPSCTLDTSKTYTKNIKKWTEEGEPPQSVSAAYYIS